MEADFYGCLVPTIFPMGAWGQIFRIGTVRYAEGLWRVHRHGPVIAHCADSEDFPARPPSRSRKPLRLAEDILRLASRLAAAYGWQPIIEGHARNIL